MTIHALLDVDVADEKFKQFAQVFDQYQEALKKTAPQWKQVNTEIDAAADAMDEVHDATSQVDERVRQIGTTFQQNILILGQQTKELTEQEKLAKAKADAEKKAAADAARHDKERAKMWHDMARDSKAFAVGIADATKQLLRWGELTGLIGGLLGAGGLFGIDRLAQAAGNERRTATGLGLTTGQERSIGVNLQRYVDPGAVENGIVSALQDPTKAVPFMNLGLNPQAEAGKGNFQAIIDTMTAVKKLVDATPTNQLGNVLQYRHLDQLGLSLQDLNRIKSENPAEFAKNMQRTAADANNLGYSDPTAKAWQDLQVQLKRAGAEIEADLVQGLVKAAPAIDHLSSAVTDAVGEFTKSNGFTYLISEVSEGLEDFSKFIGSQGFKDDVKTFAADVGVLAHAIDSAMHWIARWIKGDADKDYSDPTGMYGPATGNDPAHPGVNLGSGKDWNWLMGNPNPNAHASRISSPEAMANEVAIHNQLIAGGLSETATAGILGNLQQESGFNPMNENPSHHFGIAQWDTNRQANFKKLFGHDIRQSTLAEQVAFLQHELHGDYGETLSQLNAAGSRRQAATVFNQGFEVSGDDSGVREANAVQAGNKFATQGPSTPAYNQLPVRNGSQVVITDATGGNVHMNLAAAASGGP
jgi:hypothetical protein